MSSPPKVPDPAKMPDPQKTPDPAKVSDPENAPDSPKPSKDVEKLSQARSEVFDLIDGPNGIDITGGPNDDLFGTILEFFAPKTGPYFFYGTLQHPRVVSDVLSLKGPLPKLRPAKVIGYHRMRWGPFPALVDGVEGEVVEGKAMRIGSEEHAMSLQGYETDAYHVRPVKIEYTDGEEPREEQGWSFLFVDRSELEEGEWDLEDWTARKFGPRG